VLSISINTEDSLLWQVTYIGYLIQHYVISMINFVSDLWQVDGFLWVFMFPLQIKLTGHDVHVCEILGKLILNTHYPNPSVIFSDNLVDDQEF